MECVFDQAGYNTWVYEFDAFKLPLYQLDERYEEWKGRGCFFLIVDVDVDAAQALSPFFDLKKD